MSERIRINPSLASVGAQEDPGLRGVSLVKEVQRALRNEADHDAVKVPPPSYRGEGGAAVGGSVGHLGTPGPQGIDYVSEDAIAQGFVFTLQSKIKYLSQRRWNLQRESEALASRIERLELLVRDLS